MSTNSIAIFLFQMSPKEMEDSRKEVLVMISDFVFRIFMQRYVDRMILLSQLLYIEVL